MPIIGKVYLISNYMITAIQANPFLYLLTVLKNMIEPFISEQITLPPTVPKDRSYYELIMYNPTKDPINVKYRK